MSLNDGQTRESEWCLNVVHHHENPTVFKVILVLPFLITNYPGVRSLPSMASNRIVRTATTSNKSTTENCALLGYYAKSSGNFLPVCCPETSVINYHFSLHNDPGKRAVLTHFAAEA